MRNSRGHSISVGERDDITPSREKGFLSAFHLCADAFRRFTKHSSHRRQSCQVIEHIDLMRRRNSRRGRFFSQARLRCVDQLLRVCSHSVVKSRQRRVAATQATTAPSEEPFLSIAISRGSGLSNGVASGTLKLIQLFTLDMVIKVYIERIP